MMQKRDIRALTKEELRTFFESNGDKAFRATKYTNGCGRKAYILSRR